MDIKNDGKPSSSYIATAWITTALVASSVEPLVVKLGFRGSATAFQFLILKLVLGGLFIAPIYRHLVWVGKENFKSLLTVSCFFIFNYLFIFYSLTTISATVLITVITSTPAVVAIINQFRAKEIAGPKFWTGFLICFLGIMLTIDILNTAKNNLEPVGLMLAFLSVGTSALYRTNMDSLTKRVKPITISAYIFLINACVGLLFVTWIGQVESKTWQFAAWIGFAGAIANVAFISALNLIGSTRLSILTVLQRPLVIILAALVLKEPLSYYQIVGILMVLIGVQMAKVVKRDTLNTIDIEPVLVPQKIEK